MFGLEESFARENQVDFKSILEINAQLQPIPEKDKRKCNIGIGNVSNNLESRSFSATFTAGIENQTVFQKR